MSSEGLIESIIYQMRDKSDAELAAITTHNRSDYLEAAVALIEFRERVLAREDTKDKEILVEIAARIEKNAARQRADFLEKKVAELEKHIHEALAEVQKKKC